MKKVTALLVCLLMTLAFTACGNDNSAPPAGNNTQNSTAAANADGTPPAGNNSPNSADQGQTANGLTVIIDVDFPDMSGQRDVDDMMINVAEGSSVLDVLNACASQMGFEVTMDNSSSTAYVSAIGGVAATNSAGWMYEVNDRSPVEAADKYIVQNRDEISWDFESYYDD